MYHITTKEFVPANFAGEFRLTEKRIVCLNKSDRRFEVYNRWTLEFLKVNLHIRMLRLS